MSPDERASLVDIPENFPSSVSFRECHAKDCIYTTEWYWQTFGGQEFASLLQEAFSRNYSLSQSAARILQAKARAEGVASEQFPSLAVGIGGSRSRIETGATILSTGFRPEGKSLQNSFSLNNSLSYEIDLWQKIASGVHAAEYRIEKSYADDHAQHLVVADALFRAIMDLKSAQQLESLVQNQIHVSRTLLELMELRFSLGQSTALDVFDQRSLLASLEAQLPPVLLQQTTARHEIAVLLGLPPENSEHLDISPDYPSLPKFDNIPAPADLIALRPDLQSQLLELQASEFDVAEAVAARFPQLSLGFNYNFSTSDIDNLFPNSFISGVANVLTTLIEGGSRLGASHLQKAELLEQSSRFAERFIISMQEVEDVLHAERRQNELLEAIQAQQLAAEATYTESRSRYLNGATDYIRVLHALQNKQSIERSEVAERKNLLLVRNRLYLAFGGKFLRKNESRHSPVPTTLVEAKLSEFLNDDSDILYCAINTVKNSHDSFESY
ncbi:MAG: TolC family protein [Bdellovibrionales bacterium]|nr:TolC family protein [Bdellovibrionales bacterium]